ncbi:MAG TPA: hypothetical protein VHZ81_14560 [Galbitalea sp.]|nr:hypothetical protein [Galbitalea sp.]
MTTPSIHRRGLVPRGALVHRVPWYRTRSSLSGTTPKAPHPRSSLSGTTPKAPG